MSCIVYQTNKRTGSTYAYRSESYRDPETGKPRSRREYLGRIDPETGEIMPKRGRRREAAGGGAGPGAVDLELARARVAELEDRVAELEARLARLARALAEARELVGGAAGVLGGVLDGGEEGAG